MYYQRFYDATGGGTLVAKYTKRQQSQALDLVIGRLDWIEDQPWSSTKRYERRDQFMDIKGFFFSELGRVLF